MIRDSKPISLERWTRGEPLRSDKLNESVDAIGRLARGIAHPRQVRKARGGRVDLPKTKAGTAREYMIFGYHSQNTSSNRVVTLAQYAHRVRIVGTVSQWHQDNITRWVADSIDDTRAFFGATDSDGNTRLDIFGNSALSGSDWIPYRVTRVGRSGGSFTLERSELNKLLMVERAGDTYYIGNETWDEFQARRFGVEWPFYIATPVKYPL